ncbi:hypothetical protein FNF28_03311 [Cafeteria roenbergensis]|uniref:PH domain-containing protein n=2 Tax=Cafeteria roenbergensis TaxID=33653 RepID=A0A5A8DLB3_CAFRO|nr:hypothetical protein FNF28_03311 [Cafeteria roenbergensis]
MLADAARLWRAAGPSLATAVADKLIEDEAKAKAPGASAGAGAGAGTAAEAHAEGSLAAGDDDWMSWDGDATGAPRAEASVGGAGRPAGVPPLALGTAPAPQPLLKDPEFATAAAVVSDVQAAASRGGDAIEDREGLPDPSARPPAGKRRAAKALKRKLVQLQQLRALEQTWDSRATVTRAKDNSSLPLNDREYFDAPKPFDESTRAISPRAIDGFVRTEDGNFHLAFYALRNAERAALTERPKPFVRPGTLGRTAPLGASELRYFRAMGEAVPRGTVFLDGAKVETEVPKLKAGRRGNVFAIIERSGKRFLFQCHDANERAAWTASIQRNVTMLAGAAEAAGAREREADDQEGRPAFARTQAPVHSSAIKAIRVFSGSWNMGERRGPIAADAMRAWLPAGQDVYAACAQECVEVAVFVRAVAERLGPAFLLVHSSVGSGATQLGFHGFVVLVVAVRASLVRAGIARCADARVRTVNLGKRTPVGRAANKGAVGITVPLLLPDESGALTVPSALAFAGAHLAADAKGRSRVVTRNADAATMLARLGMAVSSGAAPRHLPAPTEGDEEREEEAAARARASVPPSRWYTVVLGDLNYRLQMAPEQAVREIVAAERASGRGHWLGERPWHRLLAVDQLRDCMARGAAFPGFSEAAICYPPTYRRRVARTPAEAALVDRATGLFEDIAATSRLFSVPMPHEPPVKASKLRTPSYTDRVILRRPSAARPRLPTAHWTSYRSCEALQGSDHVPVGATFAIDLARHARRAERQERAGTAELLGGEPEEGLGGSMMSALAPGLVGEELEASARDAQGLAAGEEERRAAGGGTGRLTRLQSGVGALAAAAMLGPGTDFTDSDDDGASASGSEEGGDSGPASGTAVLTSGGSSWDRLRQPGGSHAATETGGASSPTASAGTATELTVDGVAARAEADDAAIAAAASASVRALEVNALRSA